VLRAKEHHAQTRNTLTTKLRNDRDQRIPKYRVLSHHGLQQRGGHPRAAVPSKREDLQRFAAGRPIRRAGILYMVLPWERILDKDGVVYRFSAVGSFREPTGSRDAQRILWPANNNSNQAVQLATKTVQRLAKQRRPDCSNSTEGTHTRKSMKGMRSLSTGSPGPGRLRRHVITSLFR
jgi:hypothetical protein